MSCAKFILLGSLLLLPACVHVRDTSANADADRIKAHLMTQLDCETLELQADDRNTFSGAGKNKTGPFTLTVNRKGEEIAFQGVYTAPAQGTFGGTAAWAHTRTSLLGIEKTQDWSRSSMTVPMEARR